MSSRSLKSTKVDFYFVFFFIFIDSSYDFGDNKKDSDSELQAKIEILYWWIY